MISAGGNPIGNIEFECWYAKEQGFLKCVITKAGQTYSFSRVLP
jgi:hypothetical protein